MNHGPFESPSVRSHNWIGRNRFQSLNAATGQCSSAISFPVFHRSAVVFSCETPAFSLRGRYLMWHGMMYVVIQGAKMPQFIWFPWQKTYNLKAYTLKFQHHALVWHMYRERRVSSSSALWYVLMFDLPCQVDESQNVRSHFLCWMFV